MAIGATIFRFTIELSDVDRGVFEHLELRVAQHPSESTLFLVVRMLARCLEHADGIELTRGVSDTELPAIVVRDLLGGLTAWIEVGTPADKRVHKATSRAERVMVYAHKQIEPLIERLRAASMPRAERVTVVHFDEALVTGLQQALRRTATWSVTVSDNTLYIEADGAHLSGAIHRVAIV